MEFRNFVLDDFQVEACNYLTKGDSVVVSASTGTGKTLIAEYAIELYVKMGKRAVYTSPIKALSNQKYRDFCKEFGKDQVGILTGDVSINKDALILVMTTEVYRNMALSDPEAIEDVGLLILDEVHFMNDIERGTVWEESIIFSPDSVCFLALSATIPNAKEFADWINSIHDQTVRVVQYRKRAVPLEHFFFPGGKLCTYNQLMQHKPSKKKYYKTKRKKHKRKPRSTPPDHKELMKIMENKKLLPCIFFTFSRRDTEEKAMDAASVRDDLPEEMRTRIEAIAMEYITSEVANMDSVLDLLYCLDKGIAFHHAGMLPQAKRVVETAFEENLVNMLFATETFAVGINFPARSVAFASLRKYDGIRFRYLNSKEYYQMAGRAGRRGMDDKGTAIAVVDPAKDDLKTIRNMTKGDDIPITSRFSLSYNTVLNLMDQHDEREIKKILEQSFDSFLKKKAGKRTDVMKEWGKKVSKLRSLGHLKGNELTEKGRFASMIYTHELLTTEIFFELNDERWSSVDIACLAALIMYEERKNHWFNAPRKKRRFLRILNTLKKNRYAMANLDTEKLKFLIPTLSAWSRGAPFEEVLEHSNLVEGDIIRWFRVSIDLLQQVKRATKDSRLERKIEMALDMFDKGVVGVDLE